MDHLTSRECHCGPSSMLENPLRIGLKYWLKNLLTTLYPSASTTTIINYLDSTWLYSTQYLRDKWPMYQSVLDNDPRTNNVSEGGNNAINTAGGCSHPTIIPFVKILQFRHNAEQSEAKINQFNTAQNPNRRARPATKERNERIFIIVSRYDGLNLIAYMRRISHLYQ